MNTASESENKIHDDAVAAAYGFRGGLVPGVTVYGYLAAAAIEHFGREWLDRGAMDVLFHKPVYEGDELIVTAQSQSRGRLFIEAAKSVTADAWVGHDANPVKFDYRPIERRLASRESLQAGTILGTLEKRIDLKAVTISAPLDPAIDGFAHPAVVLALANELLVENYLLGPWIHAGSEVRNFGAVRDGETVHVSARIEESYERKGHEFAVLDVSVVSDRPLQRVRHTAIWKPRVTR